MVKAELVDSIGKNYVVARTVELMKGDKKNLKTLDSTLTTMNKDKTQVNRPFWNIIVLFCRMHLI